MAGALIRIACTELWPDGDGFPWTTLGVNIFGALLLGFAAQATLGDDPLRSWRMPLVGTGFCGALTTFSGLCIGSLDLIDGGHTATALAYLGISLLLGIGAAIIGGRAASAAAPERRGS